MNQIIESFLSTHIGEYSIQHMKPDEAFEHFIDRCIVNKYSIERFDPMDVMTKKGEIGLDGIAIIVNDRLIVTLDEIQEIFKAHETLNVKFIFVQSKSGNNFDGGEIDTFLYGVKSFFASQEERPETNQKIENLIEIKDYIYRNSIKVPDKPLLELYYVCCGVWDEGNGLNDRIRTGSVPLKQSQNFHSVFFYPYDSNKIIITYKELKKKVQKQFLMEKRVPFPLIKGITQAYIGLVKCKEFISILQDSDGKIMGNIFEDNVRDFQGYNPVNSEIQETIRNPDMQSPFAIFNNGITILAKTIKPVGDLLEIYDFQIVNGCQTSYVLFDNASYISDDSYLSVKILETHDEKIIDKVIYTTNRQTEVKSEAFASTKRYHKLLEDYYNSIDSNYRLYYERRSKQYELSDDVNKNKVITLAFQTKAYIAVFFNEPHSTHRYYGEILKAYKDKIYLENDYPDLYYIASYLSYYVESVIREGYIDKKYSGFKFHLACAIKTLAAGKKVVFGNSKGAKKICIELQKVIKDKHQLLSLLHTAVTCLDETLRKCTNIPYYEQTRNREVTFKLLESITRYIDLKNDTEYLCNGNIVPCVVTSLTRSFVNLELRTDDERNSGFVHISNVASHYVNALENEVSLGQSVQAKIINNDFYGNPFGWEMTMIL